MITQNRFAKGPYKRADLEAEQSKGGDDLITSGV